MYVNIIELLFPPRCPSCDELLGAQDLERGYCQECYPKISPTGANTCMKCGKKIQSRERELCLDCSKVKHDFFQNKSCYEYSDGMKPAMYRFKYSNRRCYARVFARDIVEKYGNWIADNEIEAILAVPIHKNKYRKRGYNQAAVLAKEISRLTQIPYDDILVRVEDTKAQKELNNIERRKNLKNAFNIKAKGVKYRHVLVVDDIYTTGATLDTISNVLHQAGVQDVYCITVCIGKGT